MCFLSLPTTFRLSVVFGEEFHGEHSPNREGVLRINVDLHPQSVLDLVPPRPDDVRSHVGALDPGEDLRGVHVREAKGETLEAVPVGDGVFYGVLKVARPERVAREALVLVGGDCGLEQVAAREMRSRRRGAGEILLEKGLEK